MLFEIHHQILRPCHNPKDYHRNHHLCTFVHFELIPERVFVFLCFNVDLPVQIDIVVRCISV